MKISTFLKLAILGGALAFAYMKYEESQPVNEIQFSLGAGNGVSDYVAKSWPTKRGGCRVEIYRLLRDKYSRDLKLVMVFAMSNLRDAERFGPELNGRKTNFSCDKGEVRWIGRQAVGWTWYVWKAPRPRGAFSYLRIPRTRNGLEGFLCLRASVLCSTIII